MTTDQPRVPAGHPGGNGGEFTSKPRSEADVVLDQLYREDEGTFHYPPICRSYDSLMKFWSNVQVPEESLARFQKAYQRLRNQRIDAGLQRWEQDNPAPPEKHKSYPQWLAAYRETEEALDRREPIMYPPLVRPLVRLNRMYAYRGPMRPEERQKFLTKQFSLPTGETGTVEELLAKFRTQEYQSELSVSSIDDQRELIDQLRQGQIELSTQLRHIRSGI